jgi:hypothetical protein
MNYSNKYFNAISVDMAEYNVVEFKDVIFLSDIGPFKRGERFISGAVLVEIDNNKIRFEMSQGCDEGGDTYDKVHEMDLI